MSGPSTVRIRSGPRFTAAAQDRRWHEVHSLGLALATLFAVSAMTPSLIPRTWLFQGVVSGITGLVGYAVGVAVAWVLGRWPAACRAGRRVRAVLGEPLIAAVWPALILVCVVALTTVLLAATYWQRRLSELVGQAPDTAAGYLRAAPVVVVVVVAGIAAVRGLRRLDRALARALRRRAHLPRRVAAVLAVVIVTGAVLAVVNDGVLRVALAATDSVFAGVNDETYPGDVPPTSPTRSGSPPSTVPWDSLGKEGRAFVGGGRTAADLAAAAGHPARDPVRVYVGLQTADDARARADRAVAELDRTGAFDRAVLGVVTTTGTGWVDDSVADPLELAYGGNTAMVATQYSYLPSWLSFLVDRSRVQDEGHALLDAVRARLDALPPGHPRPRLIAFGESLGAQGSQSAFGTPAAVRARTDGALWVGPPHSTAMWQQLVDRRDPGTPEYRPAYADGLVVRFTGGDATAGVAAAPPGPWLPPRVLYLQHPSDPIVWWSPSLLWRRPDWLAEPRGPDVLPVMSWAPVVTFWQVTADMTDSVAVPDGHGHVYQREMLDAWLAVAPPPGWTPADTDRVRGVLGR